MKKTITEKPKCFYVSPIGKENSIIRKKTEEILERVIVPVINNSYEIIIPHKINKAGNINQETLQHIREDELIIANLTGKNINVYFELGMRYGLNGNFILIAEKGTKLPFDIADERTFFYEDNDAGYEELKAKLREVIKNINTKSDEKQLKYERYLGYWLEILVDFKERPLALVEFTYDEESKAYELHGHNYHHCDRSKDVSFESELIVDTTDSRASFFYLTHPTIQDTTGIGKITFRRSKEGPFMMADGSFFDILSWSQASPVRKAQMIKCDKEFFKQFDMSVNRKTALNGIELLSNEKLRTYLKSNFNVEVTI